MTDTVDVKARAAERLDAWISRLRTTPATQIKEYLIGKRGCMCAMGVLCEVSGLHIVFDYGTGLWGFKGPVTGKIYSAGGVPKCVANAVGMDNMGLPLDRFPLDGDIISVVQANDGLGLSFKQIADLLQSQRDRLINLAK